mmetsp:Transcript_21810/g.32635  ORF Transcript_21810/g.32635 Transcript_21810/m.32635 type:complete len:560 (-) Transcript_21810:74-1753(-)
MVSKRGLQHYLFGPTTLHLKHEAVLISSIYLLTTASLSSMYKDNIDWNIVSTITVWQSRYYFVRVLATTRFSLMGMRETLIKFCFAGQYFDETQPPTDYIRPQMPIFLSASYKLIMSLFSGSSVNMTSVDSATNINSGNKTGKNSNKGQVRLDTYARHNGYAYVLSKYNEYIPPGLLSAQLCVAVVVGGLLLIIFFSNISFRPFRRGMSANEGITASHGIENFGVLRTLFESFEFDYGGVDMWWFFFMLIGSGTLPCLMIYGRVFLPIPDLVAGSNVLKAIRNEVRHFGRHSSSKSRKDDSSVPWAEQYKPIAVENRFRLVFNVIIFRVIENVFLCAILPMSELVCTVSGRCEPGPRLWERIGIPGVKGTKPDLTMFSFIMKDYVFCFGVALSAASITFILLLSQVVTLDKAYLSIMGYISTGESDFSEASSRRGAGGHRKNRRGDTSQAKLTVDRGGLSEHYLQFVNKLFSDELGPPSASNIISHVVDWHFQFILFLAGTCAVYFCMNYNCTAAAFLLWANVVACVGATEIGLADANEFQEIGEDISASVNAKAKTPI